MTKCDKKQAIVVFFINNLAVLKYNFLWALDENIGKINLPDGFLNNLEEDGYELLPINLNHINLYRDLSLIHRDPFDRMLIAQASCEQLTILTRDSEIKKYDVLTVGV